MAIAMAFLASCNKIDDYKKDIIIEHGGMTMLLNDYTGVKCVNCPRAAEIAHDLQSVYGEKLIVMSIHAGALSTPFSDSEDFRTEEGNTWYGNNDSNPLGTVNAVDCSNSLQDSKWETTVAKASLIPQTIEISIDNSYNADTRILNSKVNVKALDEINGDYYITACLVEDSIVSKQITPDGLKDDYLHRHVFRKTLNGKWGQSFLNGTFEEEEEKSFDFQETLAEKYVAKHCSLVVYVYDKSQDKFIVQAAEAPIIK